MNPENSLESSTLFILNDAQLRAPFHKIYTVKYFFLLTSSIVLILLIVDYIIQMIEEIKELKLTIEEIKELKLMIEKIKKLIQTHNANNLGMKVLGIIIAFIININSQFFGHRKLYILSYASTLGFSVLTKNTIFRKNLLTQILLKISQQVIFTQITLQIWGTWPNQFIRIFTEFIMFSSLTTLILCLLSIWIDNFNQYFLFALIIINIVLCNIDKCLNDFRSPDTDSVFKDILRLLFNKKVNLLSKNKPFIFTLLIGFSGFLLLLLGLIFLIIIITNFLHIILDPTNNQISKDMAVVIIVVAIFYILALFMLRKLPYQSTLIIFVLICLLLLCSLLIVAVANMYRDEFLNLKYESIIMFYILLLIFTLLQIHIIPQYQKILLNIGIRNLDFASSYQQLFIGLFFISMIIANELPAIKQFIGYLTLIGIIVFLSFIFYYILGFSQYFKKSNRSYVEENEFQIEID